MKKWALDHLERQRDSAGGCAGVACHGHEPPGLGLLGPEVLLQGKQVWGYGKCEHALQYRLRSVGPVP